MEDDLFFKRFPVDKQEQIRQLVSYAQLMGLTGRDLVSIGGKLDRMRQANEKEQNLEIIKSFDIRPIGDDGKAKGRYLEEKLDNRFKIKTTTGNYNFRYDYYGWEIKSLNTSIILKHKTDAYEYELGNNMNWARRYRMAVLLDIATGKLSLNF